MCAVLHAAATRLWYQISDLEIMCDVNLNAEGGGSWWPKEDHKPEVSGCLYLILLPNQQTTSGHDAVSIS